LASGFSLPIRGVGSTINAFAPGIGRVHTRDDRNLPETMIQERQDMTVGHGKIGDIETLRAWGVLLVMLQHWLSLPVFQQLESVAWLSARINGGAGVDLFFVVSGFVISREFAARMLAARQGGDALGVMVVFWIRRAWRLLPSAWLWLALCLVLSVVFNTSGAFMSPRSNVEAGIAGFLNVANFRFAETFGSREYGASYVYWSLSLEEQFYLLFPLLLLICGRWTAVVLMGVALYQLFSARDVYMIVLRCDGLALGCLLGMYSARVTLLSAPGRDWGYRCGVLVIGLVLLVSLAVVGGATYGVIRHYWSLHALIALVLVWIACHDHNFLTPGRLLRSVMHYLGARSYALYLAHVPMMMSLKEVMFRNAGVQAWATQHPLLAMVGLLLATLAVAELNFRCVETPLRQHGRGVASRFMQRREQRMSA
jgi:peptidoglycan/LPS O-acetylase OafA/YrhL